VGSLDSALLQRLAHFFLQEREAFQDWEQIEPVYGFGQKAWEEKPQ
jgi:hypothetical protein